MVQTARFFTDSLESVSDVYFLSSSRRNRSHLKGREGRECSGQSSLTPQLLTKSESFQPVLPWATPEDYESTSPSQALELYDSHDHDDDIVLDTPVDLSITSSLSSIGAHIEDKGFHEFLRPTVEGPSVDVINLVTDAFREQREKAVKERREVLYALTHPRLEDYTYGGKLVPPPPFQFGRITPEAIQLAEEILVKPEYSLVFQAGVKAAVSKALPSSSTHAPAPAAAVETALKGPGQEPRTTLAAPRSSRSVEENVFADHNFFFEINDLYQEVVLVGKASAGKSTLLNALLDQPSMARTSSTPHTTRTIQFYQHTTKEELQAFCRKARHNLVKLPGGGLQLTFVDMPGYGIEGMSKAWRDAAIELTDSYFGVRRSVNTVLFCIDCERGVTKTDLKYFNWLENVQGVFYIVLTKCDMVPHSRICSVMRQLYQIITQNRKKYRKVYPFILPTSAVTGENIDDLRGLITETSGMIPGDRLRAILQEKQQAWETASLQREELMRRAAVEVDRAHAKKYFEDHYQKSLLLAAPSVSQDGITDLSTYRTHPAEAEIVPGGAVGRDDSAQQTGGGKDRTRDQKSMGVRSSSPYTRSEAGVERSGKAFLKWRNEHPVMREELLYRDRKVKLHSGLESPLLEEWEAKPVQGFTARASSVMESAAPKATGPGEHSGITPGLHVGGSRVLGHSPEIDDLQLKLPSTGQVSKFMDQLEVYQRLPHLSPARSQRAKGFYGRPQGQAGDLHSAPFYAEDVDGRLAPYTAGKRSGPSLAGLDCRVSSRKSEWKGRELGKLLRRENAQAPWRALPALRRKVESKQQAVQLPSAQSLVTQRQSCANHVMSRKNMESFLKNAGRIIDSFEQFENEVTATKYMTEVRQSKTLRSQQQMHLNATAKINFRSMPPGLWKRYGSTNPRLNRSQDRFPRNSNLPGKKSAVAFDSPSKVGARGSLQKNTKA